MEGSGGTMEEMVKIHSRAGRTEEEEVDGEGAQHRGQGIDLAEEVGNLGSSFSAESSQGRTGAGKGTEA